METALENITYQESSIALYQGASNLILLPEEEKKLDEPIDEMDIEIRPDGLIYPPQVYWRDKLNQTFKRGQWALIKHKSSKDPDRDKVYYDGSLFIRNCFVSRATGEAEYHSSNPMQSWASVEESAKSDCLGRCCKDLGIFKELWQPNFVRSWIKKYAVKVWVEIDKNGQKKKAVSWRRIDSEPYWNETGIDRDSPNQPSKRTEQKKSDPIKNEVPGERNYTQEAESCKTLDELKVWYISLTKDEQKKYSALKNSVKDTLEKIKPVNNQNKDVLLMMIENLTIENYSANSPSIEKLMDDKPKDKREIYTSKYFDKVKVLKVECNYVPVPF
jgi:hypothetical protein